MARDNTVMAMPITSDPGQNDPFIKYIYIYESSSAGLLLTCVLFQLDSYILSSNYSDRYEGCEVIALRSVAFVR